MSRRRIVIPALFVTLVGVVVANANARASRSANAPAAPPAIADAADAGPKEVLNDWFALGSGCRAKYDEPGDVTIERLPQDPARPNVYHVRFHLDHYQAASDALGDHPPVKFARECSLRLNINPPEGMKIVDVKAQTDVVEDKSPDVKLTALEELKLGNATIGRNETVFDQGLSLFHHDEPIALTSEAKPEEKMPDLKCAQPKIIGFNYTWIVDRPNADAAAHVTLSGAKTLDIEAELAPCS